MRVYRNQGDALKGDKIAVQARRIDTVSVKKRAHRHQGRFATLRDNAFCIIEIPLKVVLDKKLQK